MIADLTSLVLPSVDMKMLILDAPAQLLADVHMVQSLAIAVEEICVSLCLRDFGGLVNINKTGCLDESLKGRNGSEFVKVTSGNDVGLSVLLEDFCNKVLQVVSWVLCIKWFETYSSNFGLLGAFLDTLVHRSASIAMQGGRAALAAKVDVDSKERLLCALDRLPLSHEGLAAVIPGRVGRINSSRVVLERGTIENSVDVVRATFIRLDKLNSIGAVEISLANVTTGLTTVLVVVRLDLSPVVNNAAGLLDTIGQSSESLVGGNDTVIGSATVVLHFLKEKQVRSAQLLNYLLDDKRQMSRLRVEVLGVVVCNCDTLARSLAGEADGRVLSVGRLADLGGSQGKNAVEAKSV
jgi:hypothetical protein